MGSEMCIRDSYKTYDDHSIVGVDMNREELDGSALIAYPLKTDMEFEILN